MALYLVPSVTGNFGEIQHNNGGVLGAVSGVTSVTLTRLLETELIRTNGSYSIGTPGTVPFGVGPITSTGMDLAPIGPDQYTVIDIRSGSFC